MPTETTKTLTLGILGGGQLGLFLALEAQKWKARVHLYIEKPGVHPAQEHAAKVFQGNGWNDSQVLGEFIDSCDLVLLENEFVPVELLSTFPPEKFVPSLASYGIFQDKFQEKTLALRAAVPVADFARVESLTDVQTKLTEWNKLVLKTCRGGYDGTGNLTVTLATAPEAIVSFLAKGPCLAERWVSFAHEVAVMVVRTETQEVVFPVAETIQHHHICHQVIAPARFSAELTQRIQAAALQIIRSAQGTGLFGVEFFVTQEGDLLYNECAPRPHNSAHFTMEGCTLSQFEAQVRVALKQSIPAPVLKSPSVGMLNLLGTLDGTNELTPLELFESARGHLWLYGKKESRPGRKMGHYTLLGESAKMVLDNLTHLQERYRL